MEKGSLEFGTTNKADKELLAVPESKNLFADTFSNASEYVNWKTVLGTAAIGTAVVLGARGASRILNSGAAAGENAALKGADAVAREALVTEAGKRAGAGTLTLEGKAIPNIVRESVDANALKSELAFNELKGGAAANYAEDLTKISRYVSVQQELTLPTKLSSVADSSLSMRSILTKERNGPEQLAKEVERITALNPGLVVGQDGMLAAGTTLKLSDDAFLKKVSDDLVFKHVPPIGQFMKGTGKITEEQIAKALEIQKGMQPEAPRKLLGQILVDNKLALQADVDLAFARQTEMKSALFKLRDAAFAK
jgi:hypothetical protein